MNQEDSPSKNRLIFIGGPALTDGFRLIGFETLTNPEVDQIEQLISNLLEARQNAFIVLEQSSSLADSKMLQQVHNEGGRIVVSEVPALQDPSCLHCELDRQIEKLMGGGHLNGSLG